MGKPSLVRSTRCKHLVHYMLEVETSAPVHNTTTAACPHTSASIKGRLEKDEDSIINSVYRFLVAACI